MLRSWGGNAAPPLTHINRIDEEECLLLLLSGLSLPYWIVRRVKNLCGAMTAT